MQTDEERKAYRRAYYEAHKAAIVAKATAWNKAHRERARAIAAAGYHRHKAERKTKLDAWRKANPEKLAAQRARSAPRHRVNHLRRKFKLTPEQYEALLAKQGGVCAVCGRTETHKGRGGKVVPLSVDHCHAGGQIRGLLCDECNAGLARFRDDPAVLRRAADYLERP